MRPEFIIEILDESWGHCDCCGQDSRSVWGWVHHDKGPTVAAYWMRWSAGHLEDDGANLDLILGKWADDAGPEDRFAVALVHKQQSDGTPALMVIDAQDRPVANGSLASIALRREDVIGTPLAKQVFAITDAIYLQDQRFF